VIVVEVTTVDADSSQYLVERIERELGIEDADFSPERMRVRIEIARTPDTSLVELLNLLEEWLFVRGLAPTKVAIDDHQYILGEPVQPAFTESDRHEPLQAAPSHD
jgi:hypothetical protein